MKYLKHFRVKKRIPAVMQFNLWILSSRLSYLCCSQRLICSRENSLPITRDLSQTNPCDRNYDQPWSNFAASVREKSLFFSFFPYWSSSGYKCQAENILNSSLSPEKAEVPFAIITMCTNTYYNPDNDNFGHNCRGVVFFFSFFAPFSPN